MDAFGPAVSRYLARQLNLSPEEEEVVLYGLEVTANAVAGMLLLLAFGALLHAFWPTAVAALAALSLRTWSGGAHATTSRNCTLITAFTFGGLGWLVSRTAPVLTDGGVFVLVAAGLAAALAAIVRWAPAGVPEKPMTDPAHRRALRRNSLTTLSVWAAALGALAVGFTPLPADTARPLILAGTLGLAWQSLSITPVGYRFVAAWDGLLNRFPGRRSAHR